MEIEALACKWKKEGNFIDRSLSPARRAASSARPPRGRRAQFTALPLNLEPIAVSLSLVGLIRKNIRSCHYKSKRTRCREHNEQLRCQFIWCVFHYLNTKSMIKDVLTKDIFGCLQLRFLIARIVRNFR